MSDKVSQIFTDRLLQQVVETQTLPWERPVQEFYPFNYFTKYEYTGVNRWLVPSGEYATANQIRDYNEKHKCNLRFQKGIKWQYVLFSKWDKHTISYEAIPDELKSKVTGRDGWIGQSYGWSYREDNGVFSKGRRVSLYTKVADISWFKDEETGFTLPSKIKSGEVVSIIANPQEMVNSYVSREGISVTHVGTARNYNSKTDTVNIPTIDKFISSERYYVSWFHELSHSTGAENRLNRKEISDPNTYMSHESISREECVAQFSCALLCNEAGFQSESLEDKAYSSHVAYLQSWIGYFKQNKAELLSIISDAEKSFQFVLKGVNSDDIGEKPIVNRN